MYGSKSRRLKIGRPLGRNRDEVNIDTFPDFLLSRRELMDVFCLPLLFTDDISGITRKVGRSAHGQYKRLGIFQSATSGKLAKLPSAGQQGFLLI